MLVIPWIRAASAKSPQFATVPTRALYTIFFGILLYRIDHHGGFGPQTYTENGKTLTDAPSMNNHPVIMSIAVLVLLTEGLWATQTSPSMSMCVECGRAVGVLLGRSSSAASAQCRSCHCVIAARLLRIAHMHGVAFAGLSAYIIRAPLPQPPPPFCIAHLLSAVFSFSLFSFRVGTLSSKPSQCCSC